eukprot:TCONS_00016706-protein
MFCHTKYLFHDLLSSADVFFFLGKSTLEDYMVLSSRVIGCNSSPVTPAKDPIIVPGNQLVREINNLFIDDYAKSNTVYVSKSVDVTKKELDENEISTLKSLPSTKTDGLLGQLPLYQGMPVFLTRNISTELGLTNGATGVIRSIPTPKNQTNSHHAGVVVLNEPLPYLVVEFNRINLHGLTGLDRNHVPVFPAHGSFTIKPGAKSLTIKRNHFPLVPAFACTAHKSQGQTLSSIVIDLIPPKGMKRIDLSFVYVPLSRIRRLSDLTILRPFNQNILNLPMDSDCKAMMEDF